MDLYWLGYTDKDIRAMTKKEIPYRKPEYILTTETLNELKTKIRDKKLIKVLDSYFYHVIKTLENSFCHLKQNAYACIFIGNPSLDGIEVEIWRVLMEYFLERNFICECIFEDKIQSRQLFKSRNNKNPDGMKSEFLLVLKKI